MNRLFADKKIADCSFGIYSVKAVGNKGYFAYKIVFGYHIIALIKQGVYILKRLYTAF